MPSDKHYDAIIVGAGQAGVPLSTALANAGWSVSIIERNEVGGTCVNWGCTPTKTMVASAEVAHLAKRGPEFGVHTGPVQVNLAEVLQRKRKVVADSRHGNERRINSAQGLDMICGEASFTGPHSLEVRLLPGAAAPAGAADDGERILHLSADRILLNTGARPSAPPLPGLDQVPSLNSTTIMELEDVPEHLLVLGGGYVGLEFGQMFRRFGSQVTIVQRGPRLLGREDADVADEVTRIVREDGIEVLLDAQAQSAGRKDGQIQLSVALPSGGRQISGSHLLVATGRTPNTERLNLGAAGVQVDERGFVRVNERLETNVPGIYALGDVKGGPAFTHISYDDFRILRANLLQDKRASIAGRFVPYTVFIDPQLGRIGLSEDESRAQGLDFRVAKIPMSYIARALETGQARGFMKAVVDAKSQQILGAAVLGMEGGEIMAMLEIAMMGHLPYTALRDGVFAHPTLAESLNTLFSSLDG
jgi:pyruvate/2-oxoglutarate dehydrogenase complex dihydrolipoamide dehydrogenase (E3) component